MHDFYLSTVSLTMHTDYAILTEVVSYFAK